MATVILVALAAILIVVLIASYRVREARLTHVYTAADVILARRQAISQSRAVVSGKIQEHLAPLFPEFLEEFNPREARFLGTPVDYIIFNGIDEGECEIVLVEVKTGQSQLSTRERRVRRAVEAGRVRWVEMRLPEEPLAIANDLRLEQDGGCVSPHPSTESGP